eukprot:TRINITY_DN470_c0_g1_i1.p1 TRINITY_DN470_c0_g1~~TRINITY_DN470_c0_g1_i1.p1  ORF type:complete len:146 (-),score=17.82 TRINITY_DN470_c0_g1_i1:348-785(-)
MSVLGVGICASVIKAQRKMHLKIVQDTKSKGNNIALRMQPLVAQLGDTIKHLDQALSSACFWQCAAAIRTAWPRRCIPSGAEGEHVLGQERLPPKWLSRGSPGQGSSVYGPPLDPDAEMQNYSLQERDLDAGPPCARSEQSYFLF